MVRLSSQVFPLANTQPDTMELEPGAVAERLGRGLQSPVQRFESAPRLLWLICRGFGGSSADSFRSLDERQIGRYVGRI
jgi:hypothetical protein